MLAKYLTDNTCSLKKIIAENPNLPIMFVTDNSVLEYFGDDSDINRCVISYCAVEEINETDALIDEFPFFDDMSYSNREDFYDVLFDILYEENQYTQLDETSFDDLCNRWREECDKHWKKVIAVYLSHPLHINR